MSRTSTRLSVPSPSALVLSALMLGAPCAALLSTASIASAQDAAVTRVDPYVVVFTAAEVPVRAGSSIYHYPIVFPKQSDTLVVDGETTGWLRVKYPANVRAFVAADEGQETGAGTVRLTRASKLKAPNANSGVKAAFLGVQETELPIGTEFKLVETIKDDSGKVTFYAVEAPGSARGWISRDAVRRATDSEAAPVLAKLNTGPAGVPVSPVGATPKVETPAVETPLAANKPTSLVEPTSVAPAAPVHAQPVTPQVDVAAREPKVEPVTITTVAPSPVTPAHVTPAAGTPVGNQPGAAPVATPPGMEIPSTIPVGDKDGGGGGGVRISAGGQPGSIPVGSVTTMEGLKELYNRVRAQPAESAEFDAAIAEFERFKGTLSGTAHDQAVAKQLDAYISVMKMRKDVRDAQNANATLSRETELMKSDVGKRVIELEKQRVYTLIGRLVRSTVYDGGRAPVLYRVMSPEPGSARTLGYLLPDPKFDYANKLEQVVGIIGELRPDESLRTNLIVPKRVDVVSLAPIVMSPEIPGAVVRPAAGESKPAVEPGTDAVKPATEMPKLPAKTPQAVAPATPAPAGEPEKP